MHPESWLNILFSFLLFFTCSSSGTHDARDGKALQNIVTYDEYSLMINGKRLFVFSGEFHPFRLPVPSLWLDIFQKIKAIGFNTVSFYVDWALLEGKQGSFSADGIFAFEPFFDAAKQAGIYLIARPGPYINAESSGGGFPGWLQRITGHIREANPPYLEAVKQWEGYIGPIMAKGQMTNGGPVILVQPENEYSSPEELLSHSYMQDVEDWYRDAGIVMPFVSNDGYAYGNFAPGNGSGTVDIYGYDSYPLGFDCANPYVWTGLPNQYFPGLSAPAGTPNGTVPANPYWNVVHEIEDPSTYLAVSEFQGGSFDSWGGAGFAKCAEFTNDIFERVFYKNDYSFGVKHINYYMLYGGTNWGNLGFPYGYTSYDYGAAIREDRAVVREKYSELKLQANFFKVSPQWLFVTAHNFTNHTEHANTPQITVTALTTNTTSFWVIRHSNFGTRESTNYNLKLDTTQGQISVPQLGGSLTLNGRDSKIIVTNYMAGQYEILYSTAEIFTWQAYEPETILLLYAGSDETNEVSFRCSSPLQVLEGKLGKTHQSNGRIAVQWETSSSRTVLKIGTLVVYLLDRNSAYDYWILDLDGAQKGEPEHSDSVIVRAGYLVRNATVHGHTLELVGDTNRTTPIEVIGAPTKINQISWNGEPLQCHKTGNVGTISASVNYSSPNFELPDLSSLDWKYADSLPEIKPTYDDSKWTRANLKYTNNTTVRNLTTPTSLYNSDYGYNTGALLYRTHFIANGKESTFKVETQGGSAFGASVWLNETFLGSWIGDPADTSYYQNLSLPTLKVGESYAITVLQDMMGFEESGPIGSDTMKTPRGILNYELDGHKQSSLEWRLTGNLGGENYRDHTRGPLNEGGMYAERQGWYQPYPPITSSAFSPGSPMNGISTPGVGFYTASFMLDIPSGWDIPLSFVFDNSTSSPPAYRVQLFVNGYQFGKYISNLGPQTAFPVPEGILDYHGENWIAMTLWALEKGGAKLAGLELKSTAVVKSGYGPVELSPMPRWTQRPDAY